MDKKYTSLEHSIRNIMTESIGAIGTDKFTKTGNSFFRSFHAEPKKGDSHPNGNAVRAARNVSKERGSQTMNFVTEEDQLVELKKLDLETMPQTLAPPTEAPTVPTPKTKPIKPKTDEPEPEVAPKPEEAPPVKSPKKVEEPTPSSKPDAKIKPEEGAASKPGAKAGTGETPNPKGETPSKPNAKTETPTNKPKVPGFPIISFPLAVNPSMGPFGGTHVNVVMHSPQEYMESTEADTIRRSIENVARLGGKNRITKQAELKAKIIDENNRKANIVRNAIKEKKAGQNPLVDTKPKLNDLELDEGKKLRSLGKAAAIMGAGGAVGAVGAVEKSQRAMDSQTQYDQESGQINPEKSSFAKVLDKYNPLYDPEKAKTGPTGIDYALDAGQMAVTPFITVPSGAAAVYRDLQRGDYTDAVLDTVGMAPFGSQAIKAPAWIASKVGGLVSKVPGLFSSGKKVVSAAERVKSSRIANPRQHGVRDAASTAASGAELGNLGRQFTNVAGERAKENNSSTAQELPGVAYDYGKTWGLEAQQGAKDIYKNVLDYAKKIK